MAPRPATKLVALRQWETVGSVTGLPDLITMIDREVAGRSMVFWRVAVDGGGSGPGLVVGEPDATGYHVSDAGSNVNPELLVGGTEWSRKW